MSGTPDDVGLGILDNAEPGPSKLKWKPVPAIILAVAIVYTVTVVVGSVTIVAINIQNTNVARACIEAGGSWLINESGARECTKDKK